VTGGVIKKFADFPATFRGPTLRPGDRGYAESRQIWNMRRADDTPALIVQPLDPQDIVAAVDYARRVGTTIALRGGGHGDDGYAMPNSALVIDTSRMKRISVDFGTGRTTVEAGALLGELVAATQQHGYVVPAGVVSGVGVAGLTLGGGLGHLTRRFGATVDNLLSVEAVTMDGRSVVAADDVNPELFWGMRGAGHNLAIATSFTFQAQKVRPERVTGMLAYEPNEAVALCVGIDDAMSRAPRELSISFVFASGASLPGVPATLGMGPVLLALVSFLGPVDAYEGAMGEVHALASPAVNMVGPSSWREASSLVDFQPAGRCYDTAGGYVQAMCGELAQVVLARIEAAPTPAPMTRCMIAFPILGGALFDAHEDSCAFPRAGAAWVCEVSAMWNSGGLADAHAGWVADSIATLSTYLTGTGYINLTADRGPEWLSKFYGSAEKWERIVELKRTWDPNNHLAHNKNVLIRTGSC
jgi:FAD/FMN-containing dehydrogenase